MRPHKFIWPALFLIPCWSSAQVGPQHAPDTLRAFQKSEAEYDTNFYKSYPGKLTGRAFTSRKYTQVRVAEPNGILKYRSNTPPNIGIGASYSFLTLNLALGLGFLAPNDNGKTHYLDLQTHFYYRWISVDLLGQFYRGYYLANASFPGEPDVDYLRPDMAVNFGGIAAYYVFNYKRFSYRASLVQDEWQKKSAGSFLAGWEFYFGGINADSVFAPTLLYDSTQSHNIHVAHFFDTGPGVGYAYTLVWKLHYFATASGTINGSMDFNREFGKLRYDHFGLTPNFNFRAAIGYNSAVWGGTISWVNSPIVISGTFHTNAYVLNTGMYRLTVTKRFGLSARTKKQINAIPGKVKDAIIE